MINGFALHDIVLDKNGKPADYIFLEVNTVFEELTGLKRKEIIGKKVTRVLSGIEKDPADWIGCYGKVAVTGTEARFEQYSEALDRWYSIVAFCPKAGQFATIFEDITKRKEAEKELQANERKIASIFNNAGDGIIYVSKQGLIRNVNPALCTIVGLSGKAIVGKNILELTPKLVKKNVLAMILPTIHSVLSGKKIPPFTILFEGRTLEIGSSFTVDEDNIACIIRDVTEKKVVEKELRESRDQLKRLTDHIQIIREEEKQAISRDIHDDLGQKLAALKMDLDWFLSHLTLDGTQRVKFTETIDLTRQSMASVHRIVRELRPPALDDLGLLEALRWLVNEFTKRYELHIDFNSDCLELSLPAANELMLFRIIQEAMTNVVQHAGATS